MSNLKNRPLCPCYPLVFKTSPAQQDSIISNLAETVKTTSAQPDYIISILKPCPYSPCCPYSPLVLKTTPAQRDSGISNLRIAAEIGEYFWWAQKVRQKSIFPGLVSIENTVILHQRDDLELLSESCRSCGFLIYLLYNKY